MGERRDVAFERARTAEALSTENRFRGLLERNEPRLRRLAYAMLSDKGGIDDVLQEAFIRAYRKLPARFESERQESAWLYRIVYRCCLDEIRRQRRRPETPGVIDEAAAVAIAEPADSLVAIRALSTLAADQRAVVLLVDLFGFDYETAAGVLAIPRGTVAWRLSQARAQLRESFAKLGIALDD